MLLHEIIATLDNEDSINIELFLPYKRSLLTYYGYILPPFNLPFLVVTSVFNSVSYGFITDGNSLYDAVETYLNKLEFDSEDDKEAARDTIMFQSIPLYKL